MGPIVDILVGRPYLQLVRSPNAGNTVFTVTPATRPVMLLPGFLGRVYQQGIVIFGDEAD